MAAQLHLQRFTFFSNSGLWGVYIFLFTQGVILVGACIGSYMCYLHVLLGLITATNIRLFRATVIALMSGSTMQRVLVLVWMNVFVSEFLFLFNNDYDYMEYAFDLFPQ